MTGIGGRGFHDAYSIKKIFTTFYLISQYGTIPYEIFLNKAQRYCETGILIWRLVNILSELWIRIESEYGSGSNPDPDSDPIRIQGFDDQKLKEKNRTF